MPVKKQQQQQQFISFVHLLIFSKDCLLVVWEANTWVFKMLVLNNKQFMFNSWFMGIDVNLNVS